MKKPATKNRATPKASQLSKQTTATLKKFPQTSRGGGARRKAIPAIINQDLTRTHKSFGIFPNALLLFGYVEGKEQKERIITSEEKNISTGEVITRQMKIYTHSDKGLPRGRDPQVLLALLHLTLQKPGSSNSLWFRKEDLIKTLGWIDNQENRQDIDEAISRYFEAAYAGLDIKVNNRGSKTKEKFSRIIVDYVNIDERKIRYLENERMFSKVVFNEEVINEIRSADLSLHLNLKIIQCLQNEPTAVRLYEVINYLTSPQILKFEVDVKELAHNRLGISKSKKTPGQCLQVIKPAAERLLEIGYLNSFNYDQKTRIVNGEVNPLMVSPSTVGLGPLPNADEKRKRIINQFVALGSYPHPTSLIVNSLPENLLDDAEIIIELVTQEKNQNAFGANFKYGGRALKHLKNLSETGEISQSLLEKAHLDASQLEKQIAEEPKLLLDDSNAGSLDPSSIASKMSIDNFETQIPLPISFAEIRTVSAEAECLWNNCLNYLKTKLSPQIINAWFYENNFAPLSIENKTLLLQVSDNMSLNWIKENYADILQNALNNATETRNEWDITWVL